MTLLGKLLCRLGFHNFDDMPILADLDTFWLKGGKECVRCRKRVIRYGEAAKLVSFAYERGKQCARTEFLAYGNGVKEVISLYGKDYVLNIANDAAKEVVNVS